MVVDGPNVCKASKDILALPFLSVLALVVLEQVGVFAVSRMLLAGERSAFWTLKAMD